MNLDKIIHGEMIQTGYRIVYLHGLVVRCSMAQYWSTVGSEQLNWHILKLFPASQMSVMKHMIPFQFSVKHDSNPKAHSVYNDITRCTYNVKIEEQMLKLRLHYNVNLKSVMTAFLGLQRLQIVWKYTNA